MKALWQDAGSPEGLGIPISPDSCLIKASPALQAGKAPKVFSAGKFTPIFRALELAASISLWLTDKVGNSQNGMGGREASYLAWGLTLEVQIERAIEISLL